MASPSVNRPVLNRAFTGLLSALDALVWGRQSAKATPLRDLERSMDERTRETQTP